MKLFKRVCCHVRDKVKLRIINNLQQVLWLRKSIIISVLAIAPLPTFSAADDEVNEVIVYGSNLRFMGDFAGNFGSFLYSNSIPQQIIGFSSQQGEADVEVDPCSSHGLGLTRSTCNIVNMEPHYEAYNECYDRHAGEPSMTVTGEAGGLIAKGSVGVNRPGWQLIPEACTSKLNIEKGKVETRCNASNLAREARCAAGEGEDE